MMHFKCRLWIDQSILLGLYGKACIDDKRLKMIVQGTKICHSVRASIVGASDVSSEEHDDLQLALF
jgi:hypothetical protein